MTRSREAATAVTIKKIHGLIEQRMQAMNSLDYTPWQVAVRNGYTTNSLALPSPQVQKVLAKKLAFVAYFPQTWLEAQFLTAATTTPATGYLTESSEVLYYVLTKSAVAGYSPSGTDAFGATEFRDTDGNGKLEFIDGWGRPLRFYRWPTRLIKPNGYGAANVNLVAARQLIGGIAPLTNGVPADATPWNIDADDPTGAVTDLTYGMVPGDPTSAAVLFEQGGSVSYNSQTYTFPTGLVVAGAQAPGFHTADTWHSPLVVSMGEDGQLGLYEPNDIASGHFGYLGGPIPLATDPSGFDIQSLSDNITNLNQRAGGK